MKDPACNSQDTEQYRIRGKGPVRLALLGLDTDSTDLLKNIANTTCPTSDPLLQVLLNHGKLIIFPSYDEINHLPHLKSLSPDAIVLFSTGSPHSIVYNKGEFTPKLFNSTAFDESVKRLVLNFLYCFLKGLLMNRREQIMTE